MTLSTLFVRTEESHPEFLRVYNSLKGCRASRKYKILNLLSNRFFYLKTAKIVLEIEKKICKFFKEKICFSISLKELKTFLKAPEKIFLQPEGVRVW